METTNAITKENIQAMKTATSICFRIEGANLSEYSNKRPAAIECIKEKDDTVFGKSYARYSFNGMTCTMPRGFSSAFAHIMYPDYDGNFQAFLKLVKAGDEITFDVRDNSNQYLQFASGRTDEGVTFGRLFCDELCVTIKRGEKYVIKDLVIDHSITPMNSARMMK